MATVAGVSCGRCGKLMETGSDEYGPFAHCGQCGVYDYQNVSEDMMKGLYLEWDVKPFAERMPKDRGCNESPTCIECPLPKCRHEYTGPGYQEDRARRRDVQTAAQVTLLVRGGMLIWDARRQAAKELGVEERTIYRRLQRLKERWAT